jgi:hypothetical protein
MGTTPVPPPTQFGFPVAALQAFDAAYLAAQPIAVQCALGVTPGKGQFTMSSLGQNATGMAVAEKLASQGYFIDVPIMVWGWDALMTMTQRITDGVKEYPDLLDVSTRVPSTNVADYPAVPVPAPLSGDLVGAQIGQSNSYYPTSLAVTLNIPVGYQYTQGGNTYVAYYVLQQVLTQTQQILRWSIIS